MSNVKVSVSVSVSVNVNVNVNVNVRVSVNVKVKKITSFYILSIKINCKFAVIQNYYKSWKTTFLYTTA